MRNIIPNNGLDESVIIEFITNAISQEIAFIDATKNILSHTEVCRRKNALYQMKSLVVAIRARQRQPLNKRK